MRNSIVATILVLVVSSAYGTDEYNKTVNQIGTQAGGASGSTAYFSIVEGFSLPCSYGVVYIDLTTAWGKAAVSNLLAAKHTGTKLSRINYTQDASGGCSLVLVEIAG